MNEDEYLMGQRIIEHISIPTVQKGSVGTAVGMADYPVEWTETHFINNRAFWNILGHEASVLIRVNNLKTLAKIIEDRDLDFWLQGRTLSGIFSHRNLLPDHDDDIGLWAKEFDELKEELQDDLLEQGFSIIRRNSNMVSVLRKDRYIDICLFRRRGNSCGYLQKWFPVSHVEHIETVSCFGFDWPVPQDSAKLLKKMYPDSAGMSIFGKMVTLGKRIIRVGSHWENYRIFAGKVYRRTFGRGISLIRGHLCRKRFQNSWLQRLAGFRTLSLDEFLELRIDAPTATNWQWRKPHMDIITGGGRFTRLGEILGYLSDPANYDAVMEATQETDTSECFLEPLNLNRMFWQSGNNFFLYPILFEFRRNVIPYLAANVYIKHVNKPELYSREYFLSLELMSDAEIKEFLMTAPLEVIGDSLTSGRHRACAMIGRLLHGKPYIPVRVMPE